MSGEPETRRGGFNLANYDTVDSRIQKFWEDHPDGRILTEIVSHSPTDYIVSAAVYRSPRDQRPSSTGFAQETVGSTNVNKTSALENCETSAIGRALANLGYSTGGRRPSREEMEKAARVEAGQAETNQREFEKWQPRIEQANTLANLQALLVKDDDNESLPTSPVSGAKRDELRQMYQAREETLKAAEAAQ